MLKRIGYTVLVLLIFAIVLVFTSENRGTVEVDLFFGAVAPTVSLALAAAFFLGWLFGVICSAFYVFKLVRERRRLRAALRNSESEVSSLRSLPIVDAE